MATLDPTARDGLAGRGQSAEPGDLWAACALPGDGPEYRFTAVARPSRLRSALRQLVRLCREGAR